MISELDNFLIFHYDKDISYDEFIKWKDSNNGGIYPDIDISPVKDDVVEYNTDDY